MLVYDCFALCHKWRIELHESAAMRPPLLALAPLNASPSPSHCLFYGTCKGKTKAPRSLSYVFKDELSCRSDTIFYYKCFRILFAIFACMILPCEIFIIHICCILKSNGDYSHCNHCVYSNNILLNVFSHNK